MNVSSVVSVGTISFHKSLRRILIYQYFCFIYHGHVGGCLDFKIITSLDAEKFGDWEANAFAPEKDFIEMLEAIDGVSQVETQTYTKMPMM